MVVGVGGFRILADCPLEIGYGLIVFEIIKVIMASAGQILSAERHNKRDGQGKPSHILIVVCLGPNAHVRRRWNWDIPLGFPGPAGIYYHGYFRWRSQHSAGSPHSGL